MQKLLTLNSDALKMFTKGDNFCDFLLASLGKITIMGQISGPEVIKKFHAQIS